MLGTLQGILRMQFCPDLRILDVLANDVAFEQRHLAAISADAEHGYLTERRDRQKPVRLVGEIDVDPLERNALFGQRDHCALHIGAKLVADKLEWRGHGISSS